MKLRKAFWAAVAVTALYLAALVWADARNQVFARLPEVAALLPGLLALSLLSYAIRYLRWQWLLRRAGSPMPWGRGWLAYLTGFAFTATPGKVGELLRIRYHLPLGIPADKVLAAFVYERAADVVAVALLAAVAVQDRRLFLLLLGFSVGLLAAIFLFASQPRRLGALAGWLRARRHRRLSRLVRIVRSALQGCRTWMNPRDVLLSLVLGLAAWTLTASAFVWLVSGLGIALPFTTALSIYPTAMLVGAASFLPGGVGPTEAVIIGLLALHGVPAGIGTLAAVAIRFSGLWFSVGCGFLAIAWLERSHSPHNSALTG